MHTERSSTTKHCNPTQSNSHIKKLYSISLKSLLSILISAVLLQSCGPVYQTKYLRTPSSAPNFESCIAGCDVLHNRCNGEKQAQYNSCTFNSDLQYSTCETMASARRLLGEKYSCYRSYCSEPDLRPCVALYNMCYQRCGGSVKTETICVARCE